MSEMIAVKGKGKADRVALWERDEAHPGGEAWVAVGETAVVARTPRIEKALREGLLEEVAMPKKAPKGKQPAANKETPPADGSDSAPAAVVNPAVKVPGVEES